MVFYHDNNIISIEDFIPSPLFTFGSMLIIMGRKKIKIIKSKIKDIYCSKGQMKLRIHIW